MHNPCVKVCTIPTWWCYKFWWIYHDRWGFCDWGILGTFSRRHCLAFSNCNKNGTNSFKKKRKKKEVKFLLTSALLTANPKWFVSLQIMYERFSINISQFVLIWPKTRATIVNCVSNIWLNFCGLLYFNWIKICRWWGFQKINFYGISGRYESAFKPTIEFVWNDPKLLICLC